MVLTVDDVLFRFRSEVDDPLRGAGTPPTDTGALWSNHEVLGYLNEAVAQVATTTLSLYKTFDLPFTAANGPYVKLPSACEILDINVAYLITAKRMIYERNAVDGTRHRSDYGYFGRNEGWEVATGVPERFSRDFKPGYIRLYPMPLVDDVLQITAVLGSMDMQCGMPLPFTQPKDIRLVLTWMKLLAYSKRDVDTYNQGKVDEYEAWFDKHAMERKYEAQRIRRAPSHVHFSW